MVIYENTNLQEDYVSFDIAKLLKEKGFNEPVRCFYNIRTEILCDDCVKTRNSYTESIAAPTLQMALKWLREVHHIDIEVRTHYLSRLKPNDVRYYSGKILKGSEDVIYTIYSKDTSEEVCEAAIKYCLENLI